MPTLDDYAAAIQMRDIIQSLVAAEIARQRPQYQYATVSGIDRANRKCTVNFPGDDTDISINMGTVQPQSIGQIVRIDGLAGDRFVSDVMGPMYVDKTYIANGTITTVQASVATPSASAPHDASNIGTGTDLANAKHVHARSLAETIYLGRNAGVGPVVPGVNHTGAVFQDVTSAPTLGITKVNGATSNLIVWWGVGGYLPSTVGTVNFRVAYTGVASGSDGNAPLSYNSAGFHLTQSSWQVISGLAAGAYTLKMQINPNGLTGGWTWDAGDVLTLIAFEA